MKRRGALLAVALSCGVSVSLGGTETNGRPAVADETAESEWECSLSTSTYLVQHGRDYVNPNLVADHGWLHLEARYNYESIKTGSLWLGYNFTPVTWFRAGIVVERTKAFGSTSDIRPGPLVGFKYKKVDFTTYWLSPGSPDAAFIFTVAVNF
jgi:hypothetical protein